MKRSVNALVDDPRWCGHPMVSLRTWTCSNDDCLRPVTAATRKRLESQPTVAPTGYLWVFLASWDRDDTIDPREANGCDGIFTDRAKIPALMVRGSFCGAQDIREAMRRLHWYQGVFAPDMFEGWDEEPDEHGTLHLYQLSLREIDRV